MPEEPPADGRSATREDVPAVAACLTSAFREDPLWGRWVFPDQASREERLYELMRFWALAAVRHPWVLMTGEAEAVAVWIPPGEPELTPAEQASFGALLADLLGPRGFRRRSQFGPAEGPVITTMWREAR
jgi:hypothetical protein